MLSSRQSARLGLIAIGVVLASCFGVLLARNDSPQKTLIGDFVAPVTLSDTQGKHVSLDMYRGKIVVVWFNSIECPVSSQYAARAASLYQDLARMPEVQFVSVQEGSFDSVDALEVQACVLGIKSPIWLDPDARLASACRVTVTPSLMVLDQEGRVRYLGSQDDDATGQRVTHRYIRAAVKALLNSQPVTTELTPAIGRAIALR